MKKYIPKHGDWVEAEINGVKIKNARVSIDKEDDGDYIYVCHNSRKASRKAISSRPKNRLGYNYSWCVYVPYLGYIPSCYKLKPATPRKTKAEKVREARAKKKGKLPDTWGQVVDGMFRIEPIPNPYNKYNCASCGAIVTTHLLENPYKELVEKVKRFCTEEIELTSAQKNQDFWRIPYNYILNIIDQEEKKINKTS